MTAKPSKFNQAGATQIAQEQSPGRLEYVTPETKLLRKRRDFYDEKEKFETEKTNFKE